ncbi:B-cell lymphoma/leukemia 11B isoform X2 [Tribolium castaneum]|uniref:B-cell lymphoma/leukemia 11B isoform X2 n=1 Tax=Tribolium castaneum TaxID=7070 RepID=UPI00077DA92F|nr:PREDICTED: B-cell lymphoma/leukemia 11B isoform X2 [Tribolium castaneum]|eukprot:XP_015834906.1 PREDICTED: B-cell lymphoma/leukemia 11B isoform X2 [Tribolium castaneum]
MTVELLLKMKLFWKYFIDADGAGTDTHQDILTCGVCQKPFALSDIVRFIQHKVASCNKENFGQCFAATDRERDNDDGALPLSTINTRRPSISAPISGKKASGNRVHTPPPASPRLPAPGDLCVDGAASSTPKRRASASPLTSSSMEDGEDIKPDIKQERMDTTEESSQCKKSRTEFADAESNTTHSEPSNYVCSTCKARLHSAWRLIQHVQHSHGIKIYIESSPTSSKNNNHSTSSASSSSSGCSSGGPPPPPSMRHHLLPPPDLHNPFGVGGLLRLPLPPLNHGPVPPAPLFSRPEHHYRIDQLVSEQFRHHGLNLAAAAAAVAAQGVPPPHASFPSPAERAPSASSVPSRERSTPNQPLSLEPQLDFYSQRLRQLAGTTSPGAAQASSPSPRKHSPPFASPSPSQLPPTSIPNNISSSSSSSNNNNNNNNSSNSGGSRATSTSPPAKDDNTQLTATPRSASTPPGKPGSPRNSNSGEAVHACEYCGKKFRYQNNLDAHRRTHTGELPYKCTVCDHACAQSSKLKRHMKIHRTPEDRTSNAGSVETLDGDESEEDDEVDEEEEEEDELEEEEAEDLSVPTQIPPKNANQSASLVGELMDKFGLSNIAQYSEAYKQALQESNSALKLQLASKDRDNNNSTSLTNQLKLRDEFAKSLLPGPPPQPLPLFPPFNDTYEATKRLKLDLERSDWWLPGLPRENKGLPGPSALLPNPLIKKDTNRRNDTCEFCGKVFKNCSNLTVHRRSHTGEKPYKCELCSYACAQSSKLTRHMKTHGRIGKDVYRCRFCEMPFSVPSTLEKHMRKCVVNQGKGHLLSTMPMLSGDEDSSASIASKEAT